VDEFKSYTLDEATQRVLERGDQAHDEFLFHQWYRGIMDEAIIRRVQSGQSQQAIAEKLGTTQSSIARLENDLNGSPSARRIWNYLVACGVMPIAGTKSVEEVHSLLAAHVYQPLAVSAHQPLQVPVKSSIRTSYTIKVQYEYTTVGSTVELETQSIEPVHQEKLVPAQPIARPVIPSSLGSGNQLFYDAVSSASRSRCEPEYARLVTA